MGTREVSVWVVVRKVPMSMHFNELLSEFSYRRRQPGHQPPIGTLILGMAMFQSAVRLAACVLVSTRRSCAYNQISASASKSVKHCIVRSTYRPAQFSLPVSSRSIASPTHHYLCGDGYQVTRIHGTYLRRQLPNPLFPRMTRSEAIGLPASLTPV